MKAATAAMLLLLGCQPASFGEAIITLDPNKTYQKMSGWEATAQGGQNDFGDWNLYKNSLMDQAVADGINRLRMEVVINNERPALTPTTPVNDNADPFSINAAGFQWKSIDSQAEIYNMMRSRLAARGETPYLVLCYVDFNPSALHQSPAEYAELMEATFLHLNSTYGWVPDAVEILLEPDNQTSPVWTAAMMANSILTTQSRLARHGWNPRFIVPSTTVCDEADVWYNNIKAAQPTTTQYIDELSYHRYGGGPGCTQAQVDQNRAAAEADGNRVSMTELIGANYLMLHTDLKAGAVAWEQYTLGYDGANPDNGGAYYLVNHTTHTVTIANRTKLLRQYFKYIRRGAVRISGTSNNAALDPVAFINTNGKHVVVVKATGGGSFNVVGLPAGSYGISYNVGGVNPVNLPDVTLEAGKALSTSIPATGVLTVFAR